MKLQIDRIDQHALTGFINRVKLIDSFVYMKIKDGQIHSAVYLPQRDAVKSHTVNCDKIFQISEFPDTDKEMKVAFFEGAKVIDALPEVSTKTLYLPAVKFKYDLVPFTKS